MNYVLDASVVMKWFIPEVHWEKAALLKSYSESSLHAPEFFSIGMYEYSEQEGSPQRVANERSQYDSRASLTVPVHVYPWQDLLIEAGQVAHETYRSVYDCLYLVLAKHLNGKMITADKKLYLAMKGSAEWGSHLLWVENILDSQGY